jgi:hypothetical protein
VAQSFVQHPNLIEAEVLRAGVGSHPCRNERSIDEGRIQALVALAPTTACKEIVPDSLAPLLKEGVDKRFELLKRHGEGLCKRHETNDRCIDLGPRHKHRRRKSVDDGSFAALLCHDANATPRSISLLGHDPLCHLALKAQGELG